MSGKRKGITKNELRPFERRVKAGLSDVLTEAKRAYAEIAKRNAKYEKERRDSSYPSPSEVAMDMKKLSSLADDSRTFSELMSAIGTMISEQYDAMADGRDRRMRPPILLGDPGTGKTAMAKSAMSYAGMAHGFDYRFIYVNLATKTTYDVLGAIIPNEVRVDNVMADIEAAKRRLEQVDRPGMESEADAIRSEIAKYESMLHMIAEQNGKSVDELSPDDYMSRHTTTQSDFIRQILEVKREDALVSKENAGIASYNDKVAEANEGKKIDPKIVKKAGLMESPDPYMFRSNEEIRNYNRAVERFNSENHGFMLEKCELKPVRSFVMIDELTRVDDSDVIMNALMQFFQEGKLPNSGAELSEGDIVMAAGNLPDDNPNVKMTLDDAALVDRLYPIVSKVDYDSMRNVMSLLGFHEAVKSYLATNRDAVLVKSYEDFDAERFMEERGVDVVPFISPRTWESVSNIFRRLDAVTEIINMMNVPERDAESAIASARNAAYREIASLIPSTSIKTELIAAYEKMDIVNGRVVMSEALPFIKDAVDAVTGGDFMGFVSKIEEMKDTLSQRLSRVRGEARVTLLSEMSDFVEESWNAMLEKGLPDNAETYSKKFEAATPLDLFVASTMFGQSVMQPVVDAASASIMSGGNFENSKNRLVRMFSQFASMDMSDILKRASSVEIGEEAVEHATKAMLPSFAEGLNAKTLEYKSQKAARAAIDAFDDIKKGFADGSTLFRIANAASGMPIGVMGVSKIENDTKTREAAAEASKIADRLREKYGGMNPFGDQTKKFAKAPAPNSGDMEM